MKNKKIIIIVISIILILAISVGIGITIYFNNKPKNKPEDVLQTFASYINDKKYEDMYSLLSSKSKANISEEDFIKRNKNIYEGIEAENFSVDIQSIENENKLAKVTYKNSMDTMSGHVDFTNTVTLELNEEKEYKIDWTSNLIFPKLNTEDKVRVKTIEAKRGSILDRNGEYLATNGVASKIGLVPGKMSDNREEDIAKIAELLNMTSDGINSELSASYVKADTFVPLKTVGKNEMELKNKLLEIKGIKIIDADERIYPQGVSTSQLVGYIQPINAEELKEKAKDGYTSSSKIGKYGLERAYESTLRAVNGSEIYIEDANGNKKTSIAKQEQKDGQDVKLTIDSKLQQTVYEQFKDDKSAVVVMNPKTGEVLALASCPSFDSNDFSLGMTTADYKNLTENPDNLLYNRYLATYAPGSSFKPIIGAIGLTTGAFSADDDFGRSGTKWQNDSSWGDFYITTLSTYNGPANLKNALIHSDNIYFAKAALKIGGKNLINSLKNIGFGQQIEFPQTISKSSYSNSESFTNETQLANSGYGQGEVLVNSIHMAMMYSAFVNEGNMIMPYLEYKENASSQTAKYYKENAFSKEAANEVRDGLIQVVENPSGTAHTAKIEGKTIAGKTGTAEIKQSKDDTEGTEIGWFNAFNVGESDESLLLVVSMVENVKGKGGSHYLLPKVRAIFAQ
ncbi:MAG: penicillin-binding transpeptidase domain-containing protein [Clostridium sp.]|nr:penicillin-binding transpeptidase domain-containing protein [Clostridium sp.]